MERKPKRLFPCQNLSETSLSVDQFITSSVGDPFLPNLKIVLKAFLHFQLGVYDTSDKVLKGLLGIIFRVQDEQVL